MMNYFNPCNNGLNAKKIHFLVIHHKILNAPSEFLSSHLKDKMIIQNLIAFQLNIVKATYFLIRIIYKKKTQAYSWVDLKSNIWKK